MVSTTEPDANALIVEGSALVEAWEKFARARTAEAEAVMLVDDAMAEVSGVFDNPEDEAAVDEAGEIE